MAQAATIKRRYGKFSEGPFMKEVVIVQLIADGDNENFVNFVMAEPAYASITPVNYDSTSDTASITLDGRRATINDGAVGRNYKVEVIGF